MAVQEFLKVCGTGTASCPHCSAPVRPLRQDGRVRIFMKGLSKKQASQWVAAIRKTERWGELGGGGGGGGVKREGEEEGHTLLGEKAKEDVTQQMYVSPVEVKVHVQRLWEREKQLLSVMFGGAGTKWGRSITDLFFLTVLPVPPSRFRPVSCCSIYVFSVYTSSVLLPLLLLFLLSCLLPLLPPSCSPSSSSSPSFPPPPPPPPSPPPPPPPPPLLPSLSSLQDISNGREEV